MAALNPYLNFNGNAEEAFNFYKSVFGGEFPMVMRFKDVPPEHQMGESDGEKIMHIALPIGKGTVLMGSDVPEMYGKTTMGTSFYISISAESEEEANKLFNGLSADGQVTMPLEKAFWGDYFGMFKDKFGVQWMVNYDYNKRQ
ncbi:MAG: VOC family protein [Chitinophagaceae bacterium]|jgi:PhnB protein|nr:VOC family protein [Chitinophagaceae bacterium]